MKPAISKTRVILFLCSYLLGISVLFCSCTGKQDTKLPILGKREVEGQDTIYHTIPQFIFTDQNNMPVTNKTFDGQIYVADFFFTSCQTICPVMKTQMARIYEKAKAMSDVAFLSHTIDPERDTVALLHDYAQRMNANANKWHFVTGVKDSIYKIAQTGYFATAMENDSEPGGFIHSGSFLLIDKNRRIRGKYDGTNEQDVDRLIRDIEKLRIEHE